MKVPQVLVTLALVSLAVAGAIPKPGEHKDRVIDKVSVNILKSIHTSESKSDASSHKNLFNLSVGIR